MNPTTPYRFPETLLTDQERAAVEAHFPEGDWRYEVGNGDTRLGYEEWLMGRIEGEGLAGRKADASASEPLFCIDAQGVAVFIGDLVEVEPKGGGSATRGRGQVCGFQADGRGGFLIRVAAGEDEPFDCDADQVTLAACD